MPRTPNQTPSGCLWCAGARVGVRGGFDVCWCEVWELWMFGVCWCGVREWLGLKLACGLQGASFGCYRLLGGIGVVIGGSMALRGSHYWEQLSAVTMRIKLGVAACILPACTCLQFHVSVIGSQG